LRQPLATRVLLVSCHPIEDSYQAALHRTARAAPYLTEPADLAACRAVRERHVPAPASTLLVPQALARPQFKIEIEAIAATYE
jgi:enamine deaminase RidA (YjgF/YER057c/UK114 family)